MNSDEKFSRKSGSRMLKRNGHVFNKNLQNIKNSTNTGNTLGLLLFKGRLQTNKFIYFTFCSTDTVNVKKLISEYSVTRYDSVWHKFLRWKRIGAAASFSHPSVVKCFNIVFRLIRLPLLHFIKKKYVTV